MPHTLRLAGMLHTALLVGFLALPARAASPAPSAPAPGNYVNDQAGVMDAGAVSRLNGVLAELDAKAKAQVAVLTVRDLGGSDLEGYAARTYKKWGIGDKKTNRGVLLLLALDDRKSRIEVGYGLEGLLPDGLTGGIQDRYMVPYFKKGDYSAGLTNGALAVASIIAQDSGVELGARPVRSGGGQDLPQMTPGQLLFLIIIGGLVLIFAIRHPVLFFLLINTLNSRSRGGGGSGGFGGGGFGGFGGGMSGGGGSSRGW